MIGQGHVVKTLEGALQNGRIGHAYLFTGPRGTGKTTIARIFAKALNCDNFLKKMGPLPCNKCDNCLAVNDGRSLDLLEIDAASNRGIDDVRGLKESAMVSAPGGGFKVFLIDEVHMLTKDAFNALLKIIEEPPSHIVFILATTEPQKILTTVLSRVQRFDFKRLTQKEIIQKLKSIAQSEGINVDEKGLMAIAASSDGALRDAEVSLMKVITSTADKNITADDVTDALGLVPISYHPEFLGYLNNNDQASAISFIHKINDGGVDLENFSKDFLDYLRKILIAKINPATLISIGENPSDPHISNFSQSVEAQKLIKLINIFTAARSQIKNSPIPQLPLELAVMEATQ